MTNDRPTISVCMTTYNGERFVTGQIQSILDQLGSTDELIVSDDGSTDGTLAQIQAFSDPRIRLLTGQRFGSPVRNVEYALNHASGEIVFLADQDDRWWPGKVGKCLTALQTHDLVVTDCRVVDADGQVLRESFFAWRGSRTGFWRNLYKNAYIGCCMAFRREVLAYVLPFPAGLYMHDWWIGLLAERLATPYFLYEPLLDYVRHGQNASPTGDGGHNWPTRLRNRANLLWHVSLRLFLIAYSHC